MGLLGQALAGLAIDRSVEVRTLNGSQQPPARSQTGPKVESLRWPLHSTRPLTVEGRKRPTAELQSSVPPTEHGARSNLEPLLSMTCELAIELRPGAVQRPWHGLGGEFRTLFVQHAR